jgi:hypothetical protein
VTQVLKRILLATILSLSFVLVASAQESEHRMTHLEISLWEASLDHFRAEPETIALACHKGRIYGETDRRCGGTCRNFGLWILEDTGWKLIVESLSLDSDAGLEEAERSGIDQEVRERLDEERAMVLDELPRQWDLDIDYRLRP